MYNYLFSCALVPLHFSAQTYIKNSFYVLAFLRNSTLYTYQLQFPREKGFSFISAFSNSSNFQNPAFNRAISYLCSWRRFSVFSIALSMFK